MDTIMSYIKKGHASLVIGGLAAFAAAIPTHGYTMMSVFVWLACCACIFGLRFVAKTDDPSTHRAVFCGIGALALTVLPQYPADIVMLRFGLFQTALLVVLYVISRVELKYVGVNQPVTTTDQKGV